MIDLSNTKRENQGQHDINNIPKADLNSVKDWMAKLKDIFDDSKECLPSGLDLSVFNVESLFKSIALSETQLDGIFTWLNEIIRELSKYKIIDFSSFAYRFYKRFPCKI